MKRFKILPVFVVSLMLSQYAQCAETGSAKGPLTAAENAQCQIQRTEFNQGVHAYNAALDEIKKLEAEFDLFSAELKKEQATVDRRDKVAMQALNAKIDKNNELVARHEQMASSIKTLGTESEQRAEQFRDACDNRPLAPSPPLQAKSSDSVCSSATGAKDVGRQIEATFDEMRADEKQRQAEVERVAKARAKAQSWTGEKQGKVWLQILASPKFMAFEREKQPYVQELMRVLGSKPKSGQEECLLVKRIAATLPAIKAINTRQYAFMADEIRVAK